MSKLLIYVPKLTNRIGYTLNLTFRVLLRCEFAITTDKAAFLQHEGAKLCYNEEPLGDALHFKPVRLLFTTSIEEQEPHLFLHQGLPAIFPVYGRDTALPFDPFAAIFFIISRYEEYLPFHKDEHDRFCATESFAYKNGFLQTAIVDRWALTVRDRLLERYPDLAFPTRNFQIEETVDIDAAYCYKRKGLTRTLLGLLRDGIIRHDMEAVRQRIRVIREKEQDPFDTFDYIIGHKNAHKEIHLIFFALMGDYDRYDKPTSHNDNKFRQLLLHLGDHAKMGVHPSYASYNEPQRVDMETHRLENILHRHIVRSRYHFLRLQLPKSYHTLSQADIQHDYTMGYAETPGFRAGTTTPHPFYDLEWDCETSLIVHPFVTMDTTMQKYLKMNPSDAIDAYKKLIDEIYAVGSVFNAIWHNQNLCEQFGWQGWRQVYEETLGYACQLAGKKQKNKTLTTQSNLPS